MSYRSGLVAVGAQSRSSDDSPAVPYFSLDLVEHVGDELRLSGPEPL